MPQVRINGAYALYDADSQQHVAPKPDEYFDETHPLVQQHRWAFSTDDELAAAVAPAPVEVPIESATAAPGEKRRTSRSTQRR